MPTTADRRPGARYVRAAGEAVLSSLVAFAVWPFASADPDWEAVAAAGVALLAGLWALHAVLTGEFEFRPDIISVSLAGLAVWTAAHLVPLPEAVVEIVCPLRAEWHRDYLPAVGEALPGEPAVPRPATLPLSVSPAATRDFLGRVLAVLIVYAAARSWLASREAFRRFAWAATANGASLAVFAIAQSFVSPRNTIYGIETPGSGYGPFVCRNHFPDYINLCVGLAVGLLLPPRPEESTADPDATLVERAWDVVLTPIRAITSARSIGLAVGIGLMIVSIPFSLSRGGTLAGLAAAVAAALLARAGGRNPAWRFAAGGGVGVAVLLAAWFGAGAVEARLKTVATGEAFESRIPMWKDAVTVVPRSWPTGTGAGAFQWAEASVRTNGTANVAFDSAHNEYLEALVDGGVVGLGLTVVVAFGGLVVVGRGFVRRRTRSVGPLLLGAWFGLAALALHSFGDFGARIPAVALLAAAVAGFAVAAAEDPEFGRQKTRRRVRKRRADAAAEPVPVPPSDRVRPAIEGLPVAWWVVRGPAAGAIGVAVALAAVAVALDARSRAVADRMITYAAIAAGNRQSETPAARAAEYLAAAARARPGDTNTLADAALGEFAAAHEATVAVTAAIAGPAVGSDDARRTPVGEADRHFVAGLRYAVAARAACPLNPRPHHYLGQYAGRFATAEPPTAHFLRAKKLLAVDAYIWYRVGLDAYVRGDFPAAWENWKGSLARSPAYLVPIVFDTAAKLSPTEMISTVLPADADVLLASADWLYPDRVARAADRRAFLEAAAKLATGPGATAKQLAAGAKAADELGDADTAAGLWHRAAAAAPDDFAVHDEFAKFLEREERYAEAIVELEWLSSRRDRDPSVRDRLEAAKHGAKLAAEIGK